VGSIYSYELGYSPGTWEYDTAYYAVNSTFGYLNEKVLLKEYYQLVELWRERVRLEISKIYITLLRKFLNILKALEVFKMEQKKLILIQDVLNELRQIEPGNGKRYIKMVSMQMGIKYLSTILKASQGKFLMKS